MAMCDRQPRPTLDDRVTLLIRHGRDREAAALAVADRRPRSIRGAPMNPAEQLDMILPVLGDLTASLDESQLDTPTTSTAFTVRNVLEHMTGGGTMFAAAFRGEAPPAMPLTDDARAAFRTAMNDLQDAVHSPGALDRTIDAPFGEVPGEAFARFVALDGLVHGWDIATAIGRDYDPPLELVQEVDAFARQAISPGMRDGDAFAEPVDPPADASPLTKLVAFTGRRV
jgi:uncharacterized protein (TIGR03086 family)